jgi:hypothetical protein
MMLGRTPLLESVPYGTVFLTATQKQYIDGGSFYVPMTIDKAMGAFIEDLQSSGVSVTHKPEALVDELVKAHGLVIVYKSSSMSQLRPDQNVVKLNGTDFWYAINGIDGDFTFDQVESLVSKGTIKATTEIKVMDRDYRDLCNYTPAYNISSLRPLFINTATEPPPEISSTHPAITVVAKSPAFVNDVFGQIQQYFDVEPQDTLLYCQNVAQALSDKGVVKTFKDIEKHPKASKWGRWVKP